MTHAPWPPNRCSLRAREFLQPGKNKALNRSPGNENRGMYSPIGMAWHDGDWNGAGSCGEIGVASRRGYDLLEGERVTRHYKTYA